MGCEAKKHDDDSNIKVVNHSKHCGSDFLPTFVKVKRDDFDKDKSEDRKFFKKCYKQKKCKCLCKSKNKRKP